MGWERTSQVMVIQPSAAEFEKIEKAIEQATADEYDMDIIENLYQDTVVKLPQRPYNLLTGEFRRYEHSAYLGSSKEKWDAETILAEAKFVHFSDWPVPKPWIRASKQVMARYTPPCGGFFFSPDCKNRQTWLGLYYDFAVRRKRVCGAGFELESRELSPEAVMRHGKWYELDEVDA